MKRSIVQTLLFLTGGIYGLISIYQITQLLKKFVVVLPSAKGLGTLSHHPDILIAAIALNIIQLMLSIYFILVASRLIKGSVKGLKAASILSLFLLPIGTVAGICGLMFFSANKEINHGRAG